MERVKDSGAGSERVSVELAETVVGPKFCPVKVLAKAGCWVLRAAI